MTGTPNGVVRIAVSGTHCSGKSTLIEDFLAGHSEYVHEPEPYELGDDYSDAPGVDELFAQLERSMQTLSSHERGTRVIAERCPLDFLAYLLALCDLRRAGRAADVIASATELAVRGMDSVDLLVIVPLEDAVEAPESEDLELREAMNERLLELVEQLQDVRVVEVQGTPRQRLAMLERAIAASTADRRRPAG